MMAAQGSTRSFLPWLLYFLLCLLFQVMKTERLTETLSCCFPDPDDLLKAPPPPLSTLTTPLTPFQGCRSQR